MNLGTLRELRADNAKTHALLTELIEQQKRTNELLSAADKPTIEDITGRIGYAMATIPTPFVMVDSNVAPALAGTLETEPPPMAAKRGGSPNVTDNLSELMAAKTPEQIQAVKAQPKPPAPKTAARKGK